MPATLTILDETTFSFGGDERGFALDLPTERLTVRELIRARVYQEVHEYNLRRPSRPEIHGSVTSTPTSASQSLRSDPPPLEDSAFRTRSAVYRSGTCPTFRGRRSKVFRATGRVLYNSGDRGKSVV